MDTFWLLMLISLVVVPLAVTLRKGKLGSPLINTRDKLAAAGSAVPRLGWIGDQQPSPKVVQKYFSCFPARDCITFVPAAARGAAGIRGVNAPAGRLDPAGPRR